MNGLRFLLLSVFLIMLSQQASAQAKDHAQIRLIPERTIIEAGETIFVAIEQKIESDWHTYWVNPGDSGEPLGIEWELPKGFEAGDIKWPTPKKIDIDTLTSYGYEHEAILLQEITAPYDLKEGSLTFKANIVLLVCADICIPEYSTHSLTLNDPKQEETDNAVLIDKAYDHLPRTVNWNARFREEGKFLLVDLPLEDPGVLSNAAPNTGMDFIPYEWGLVLNSAPAVPEFLQNNGLTTITSYQMRDSRPLDDLSEIKALFVYHDTQGIRRSIEILATPDPVWQKTVEQQKAHKKKQKASDNSALKPVITSHITLLPALLLALLGGLILNLMPCVFPVLSIKALKLCRMGDKHEREARIHGLLYTAGILVSFAFIAGVLMFFRQAGVHIGWGFQLQNSLVVLILSWLLFAIGMNLSGFFDVTGEITNTGAKWIKGSGYAASFFTGLLAAIVATPCTAPFMGAAIGFALTQSTPVSFGIFLFMGLGLALPYLLLSFVPALRGMIPKPGHWMKTFKEFLAFPMYGSAVWLVWVYTQQSSTMGVFSALGGMVSIAFAVWLFRIAPEKNPGKAILRAFAIFTIAFSLSAIIAEDRGQETPRPSVSIQNEQWESYTQSRFDELEKGDTPLFINMTAAWCITCKINERVALNTRETKKLFKDNSVKYLKGDWTNSDPDITDFLALYGRNGVPLYIYYGGRNQETGQRPEPAILPQILTPGIMAQTMENSL